MNRWVQRIWAGRPRFGMWLASGSGYVTEICAGSGIDWVLLDQEHAPNDLHTTLEQLQVLAGYPDVDVLVRPPSADPVTIKRLLDIGVQNLIVPMIDDPAEACAAVAATRYPPTGIRGVGSALARASRWNRISDYLATADASVSLTVQVETVAALEQLGDIADVDGVDAVFIGPADLAASMGKLGQPEHPEVVHHRDCAGDDRGTRQECRGECVQRGDCAAVRRSRREFRAGRCGCSTAGAGPSSWSTGIGNRREIRVSDLFVTKTDRVSSVYLRDYYALHRRCGAIVSDDPVTYTR